MRSFRIYYQALIGEELACQLDRNMKVSSAIVSQVEDEVLRTLLLKLDDRIPKLFRSLQSKTTDTNESDGRFDHVSYVQGAYTDLVSLCFQWEWQCNGIALDEHLYLCTTLTTN